MPVKEGGLVAAVVVRVPAGPRADDPLDEVAHGEEQQQDQDARQLPRKPAHVVEEYVDGELAAAHRGGGTAVPGDGGRTALLAVAALDPRAALEGLTSRDQACRQEGASARRPAAARQTGHHFWISLAPKWPDARVASPDAVMLKSVQVLQGCIPLQLCSNHVLSQPLQRGAGQQVPP